MKPATGIRIVIDSNMMQDEGLREFLTLDRANMAVLTDYAAMESFKTGNVAAICASWEVLSHFPDQILALKGTLDGAVVDPRYAGIGQRMISKPETDGIPEFVGLLGRATAGEQFVIKQLMKRAVWAKTHMTTMLAQSADMGLSIEEFASRFTERELATMRRKDVWKAGTLEKLYDVVDELAAHSFQRHPLKPKWEAGKHRANHFLFRHALAYAVYMLHLIELGATGRKPEKVRNDHIDVIFATYGTYFNGLMTRDAMADKIHHIIRIVLASGKARMPVDYVDHYAALHGLGASPNANGRAD